MTDNNLEQMLKQFKVKRDNFIEENEDKERVNKS